MDIQVTRKIFTDISTISNVSVDGKWLCLCLEDKVRKAGEKKVYGKTAIGAGTYHIVWNRSKAFSERAGKDVYLPLLLDVPNFAGVRIHSGNDADASLGCLILGMAHGKDSVSRSREACKLLYDLIESAVHRNEGITLTIK